MMPESAPPPGRDIEFATKDTSPHDDGIGRLAVELAQSLTLTGSANRHFPLPAQLNALTRVIDATHQHFEELSRSPQAQTSPATEWLLDNYYIVRQAFQHIKAGMPADFYRRLPKANLDGRSEMARIYILASSLTTFNEGRLDADSIISFVQAYQGIATLKIGEVWAFALMLRLSVLEMLAVALGEIRQAPFVSTYPLPDLRPAEGTEPPYSRRAPNETIVSNCIISLRMLDTQDWKAFFEQACLVERVLRADPAGIYPVMDFQTRNRYRNVIEELAQETEWDELGIAQAVGDMAKRETQLPQQHIGYYLIGPGRDRLEKECRYRIPQGKMVYRWFLRHALPVYLGSILAGTVLLSSLGPWYAMIAGGTVGQILLALLLMILPASAATIHIIHWLVVQFVPPGTLPQLEFQNGVPAEFSTMVVIPTLLKSENELQSLLRQLEDHFIGNADPNIHFALLTDFADADQKELPSEHELIEQAKAGIEHLTDRYGSNTYRPFFLFHRDRIWNPREGCWMGWERKRGKLEEFNQLLISGVSAGFSVQVGDLSLLPGIRYIITTDADTVLPRDAARRLIGTLAHPLNRAEFAPGTDKVVSGYTVLQPRIQVRPSVANQSIFTRIFSGDTMLDLYSRAVSDIYQDLFSEGNYVGKGIYDLAAFERCLRDRVPENAILSHDLFEGLLGRCALVTDIVLFEDYPPHYLAFTHRLHRWVRGDWQLLPWLMPQVPHRKFSRVPNDLTLLSRWRIFDNLRRSLVTPAIFAMFLCSLFLLPGFILVWVVLALLNWILMFVTSLLSNLRSKSPEDSPDVTAQPLNKTALRLLYEIIFLPHETLTILDAIMTTLVRLSITRRRLLQWVTAAHTINIFGRELNIAVAWREMVATSLFVLILILGMILWHPDQLLAAFPILMIWLASPYFAVHISQAHIRPFAKVNATQKHTLHMLARSTWLFFEHFVGPEDHWLPPDHFQEDPRGLVAHRTSPTNIGLLLLSTLAAYDFGYIGPQELALRIRNTFETLKLLKQERGHFLNWYDTHSLAPLPPRYVSTVDSGNLAACLLVLRQGFKDVLARPVINWGGLADTLDMLFTTLEDAHIGRNADKLREIILDLRDQVRDLEKIQRYAPHVLVTMFSGTLGKIEEHLINLIETSAAQLDQGTLNRLSTWVDRARSHLESIQRDLQTLGPWSASITNTPALFEQADLPPDLATVWNELQVLLSVSPLLANVPATCTNALELLHRMEDALLPQEIEASVWCKSFADELVSTHQAALALIREIQALDSLAEKFFKAMDFRFLFDLRRQVFHIGLNVESGRLDSNYYDLLASESRITSLIAIAKNDVPQSHWLYLARPLVQVQGMRVLLSWSSTMFEYLMPTLFLRSYSNTLLAQSCSAAVQHQVAYGKEKGVPWGISESSFYYVDASQVYQYHAFGVPGLGFKRGLDEDLVVAPYASLLALPFDSQAVMQNIENLRAHNMFGLYGFYESLDFTTRRLSAGQEYAIVKTYMAHHQGMVLLALDNFLLGSKTVRRFHADPRIRNVELLLQEQTPPRTDTESLLPQGGGNVQRVRSTASLDPWPANPAVPYPQVHCLSNGSYSLLMTASGSGYSHWRDIDLTRWRADTTLDQWGIWLYVRDDKTGRLWSATGQPVAAHPDSQKVDFYPHRLEFERRDDDISIHTRVAVAADDDVEIRRISLTNHGEQTHYLSLTSYAEVILAPQDVDRRHPAFNRMFTESEFVEDGHILLFHRRPRAAKEKPVYLAHFVVLDDENSQFANFETDRAQFLGPGGTTRKPAALSRTGKLSGTTSTTLDPIFAMQTRVTLPPYETTRLAYLTLAAPSRKEAIELAQHYRQWTYINGAFNASGKEAEYEMMRLNLASSNLERIQKLLSALLYPSPVLRADPDTLAANTLGQPGLWPFSISGDYPIMLVRLKGENGLQLLTELLQAHTYWRRRGLMIDLVILNQRETSYNQGLAGQIHHLLLETESEAWLNRRGGIFILREDQFGATESILLAAAARVILDDDAGSLDEQLRKLDRQPVRLPHFVAIHEPYTSPIVSGRIKRPEGLLFDNGLGGFTPDGREYVIYLEPGQWTPAPWINVIANPDFGFLVSNNGLGCTWAQNSGENRLTPWHNDPVSDPPSEAVYLRDEDTGQLWSPTPLPARANAPYLIRHGAGYSVFEHESHGLGQVMRLFAVPEEPVKIVQIKLENKTPRTRRINVTYYAEWVLGNTRDITAQYVVPEFDSRRFALLARNPYNVEFAQRVAFLAATRELHWVTTDRAEFLGVIGNYARPAALERVGLTASVRAGFDPCAAVQILLWLAPGETKEVSFLLGQGADRSAAEQLISHYQSIDHIDKAWESVAPFWERHLGAVQVKTPDPAMDILLNRWLLYQALSCRIWGRTAFYQSSGAFGFRDQLQDVLALLDCRPDLVRDHLLLAASRQFEEGDVLHWWHPPSGRGIRTRISDNLLWLPYITAKYVETTGDVSLLGVNIPFLRGEPLKEGEDERYGLFLPGTQEGTLYEHCLRAIRKGVTAGAHGLPLMGAGDWNDGMNRVGIEGKGESIWLGWFAFTTLTSFAGVCEKMEDFSQAEAFRRQAETLQQVLEAFGWDGKWYRRAYFDDGTALGSVERRECQIDSISQSWAVLSGAADPERARQAMDSLYERLVRPDDGIILLLDPPFNLTLRDPGYIKGYPPGIRENGGQYTHAATWASWAFVRLGQGQRAVELFRMMNPIYHSDSPQKVGRYRVEPYVIAADVYSVPPYTGRGGWTWYTGSASWMYRLGLEAILGLRREQERLYLSPAIPADWPSYEIHYRFGRSVYHIHVDCSQGKNGPVESVMLDGKITGVKFIPLVDDGQEHQVVVALK